MNFRQLAAFVAVYEETSFTRAATRLNATQSGLSMQVQALEQTLATQLFERGAKGVSPTVAGRKLYDNAVSILRQVQATESEMAALARGVSGRLRLGLMPTFTRGALAPALAGFVADYPDIAVSMVEAYSGALTDMAVAGEIDFAIVPKAPARDGVRMRYLGTDRELLVRRAGGTMPHLLPVRLADLGPLKLVVPARGNARRDAIETYVNQHGADIAALIEMDAMIATLEFVAYSDWVTILPATICANDLDGVVRSLHPLTGPPLTVEYALIEPARDTLSPAAGLFLKRLELYLAHIDARWDEIFGGTAAHGSLHHEG